MKRKALLYLFAPVLFLVYGCSSQSPLYYEVPRAFEDDQLMLEIIENYRPHLSGKTIFIDPGHGGEDRRGGGPLGSVEADVNLNVALSLRDFLELAGATVILSRTTDETVDLKYRSVLANESGANLFVSIHHNAPGREGDNWTNYTSTYYHATKDDYEYEPVEHDVARYIQRDLAYAMRNPGGLGSFDGTYSDYWIYPGEGFSVLRRTEIPAVLVEAGFFTHWMEEQRLMIEDFNRIEGWGIFLGLGRYFRDGYPEIAYLDTDELDKDSVSINYELTDEKGIAPESIEVFVDQVPAESFTLSLIHI